MSNPNEYQVGGKHYQTQYQHWDFVHDCLEGRYLEGCITKYISRWRKKNGLQDLLKSKHYAEKLLSRIQVKDWNYVVPLCIMHTKSFPANLIRFCTDNGLTALEVEIMGLISNWRGAGDVEHAIFLLNQLILPEQEMADELAQMRQENP